MSSRPAAARSRAETLPECEPPRTTLGPPMRMARPASCEAFAASMVVGNSAMLMPRSSAASTWAAVASSWLARTMDRAWLSSASALRWRSA